MNQTGKETIINRFVYSSFNSGSQKKIKKKYLGVVLHYFKQLFRTTSSSESVLIKTQQLRADVF